MVCLGYIIVNTLQKGDNKDNDDDDDNNNNNNFFSRRHNPLWVCIHSPLAGF
jgi:hypothetical protein